jgi:hypothetical protein
MSPACRLIASIGLAARLTHADEIEAHDLNPLLTGFSLPAGLPTQTITSFSLSGETGNVSLDQSGGNEHLQLDAQVTQWTLRYTRPLHDRMQLQISMPWVELGGGRLDHFIESWHHTFGLPNGNRGDWPKNRLLIQHDLNGFADLQVTTPQSGAGDASLSVGTPLERYSAMLWLTVKLPTGNAKRLTGSGTTDVSLTLNADHYWSAYLSTYASLSINRFGNGTRLITQQRNHAISGLFGGQLQVTSHWQAVVQVNGHSAIYDSTARVLGNALQLSFGPAYQSSQWRTALLISEDIAVDTAPDVQFMLAVSRRL